MNYSQKFIVNPAFRVEKFDNEILLYAVSNTKGVYLNETAYLIWEMCKKENSLEEIIDLLERAYPEKKETIAADVFEVVKSLLDSEALIVGDA